MTAQHTTKKENLFMTTKISQWRKIALLAAGISASMASVAWAGSPPLYELHSDGTIWQSTGVPCNGNYCPGWVQLGVNAVQIAAGGAGQLYMLANDPYGDYQVYRFTGQTCTPSSSPPDAYCPGWALMGNYLNDTYWSEIWAAGGTFIAYSPGYGSSGYIFEYNAQFSTQECETACPWLAIDFGTQTAAGIYVGDTGMFERHFDNSLWKYTGPACSMYQGDFGFYYWGSCPGWVQVDFNPNTAGMAVGTSAAYQMWQNGFIWQYTGTPCNSSGFCTGWEQVGNNQNGKIGNIGITTQITAGGNLYQAQNNGSIWQYTGVPCSTTIDGTNCWGWTQIDNNPQMAYIVAGPTTVYEVHNTGSIWQYTGTPCNTYTGVCSGWTMLDDNSLNVQVVYGL
jgi:hypothetical protein